MLKNRNVASEVSGSSNGQEAPKILAIGEVLWDLFPEGEKFGGAPANFACHASILAGNVSLLSAVGDDERGREAIRILENYRIDSSLVQSLGSAPTGTVGVVVDARGRPEFTIHADSAWDQIAWSMQLDSKIAELDALYFGTLAQRCSESRATICQALEAGKQQAVARVLDVNLRRPYFDDALIRDSIQRASILKLSDEELEPVAAACGVSTDSNHAGILRRLQEIFQLDLVAMTRGAAGALLVTSAEVIDQPGISTRVVDTVGAGDSFTAAMLIGWLRGDSLQSLARFACETAAATCTHRGALP